MESITELLQQILKMDAKLSSTFTKLEKVDNSEEFPSCDKGILFLDYYTIC